MRKKVYVDSDREGGDIGLEITLVPKDINPRYHICWIKKMSIFNVFLI